MILGHFCAIIYRCKSDFMPNPQGDDNRNQNQNLNQNPQKADPLKNEKKDDYAKKMWNHIHKTNAQKERGGVKEQVKRDEVAKELPQQQKPVNPFATAASAQPAQDLPPVTHEQSRQTDLKKDNNLQSNEEVKQEMYEAPKVEKKIDQDVKKMEEKKEEEAKKPINPFDSGAFSGPSSNKTIEKKPLDKVQQIKDDPAKKEKDPEEKKQAKEKSAQDDEKFEKDLPAVEVVETKPRAGKANVAEVSSVEEEEAEDYKESVWDVLEQAGITKKSLAWILGIFVAVIVLIIIGIYGFLGGDEKGSDPVEIKVEKVEKNEVFEPREVVRDNVDFELSGLISSYIFGLEDYSSKNLIQAVPMGAFGNDYGVRAAFEFGFLENEKRLKYVQYVSSLRDLQNIYDVDVYLLLNQSVDRRKTLETHLDTMNELIEGALDNYKAIELQLEIWSAEYDFVTGKRDEFEQAYFVELDQLHGEKSYVNLLEFVEEARFADSLKAHFSSYKVLREMYINSINALRPRFEDISYNKEALIKGVHVFDIPKSEINAIIRLQNE
jgi:hypothetical protein